jgi:hypothetical protein
MHHHNALAWSFAVLISAELFPAIAPRVPDFAALAKPAKTRLNIWFKN